MKYMKHMKRMKRITLIMLQLVFFAFSGTACGRTIQQAPEARHASFTVNVENPTTQYLMEHAVSTFERGSRSTLDDAEFRSLRSSALDSGYRNDEPQTVQIHFDMKQTGTAHIEMATDKRFRQHVLDASIEATKGRNTYILRNFVPGNRYFYRVTEGRKVLTQGSIAVTGQLRMIQASSSWNIRDLGGWTGWHGYQVRYEQIYRGGSLGGQNASHETYFMTDADLAELSRIGIKAHLDLRAMPGKGAWPRDPKRNAHSLGYTTLPDAHFINTATDFALYDATRCSAAVGNVAWIIQQLKEGRPVYFHCRTGADRTGVMGYTILGLLGCDEHTTPAGGNQIAADYELTSLGMDEEGTIAFNTYGTHPRNYSNRYANTIETTDYNYFRTLRHMEAGDFDISTFQLKCYYYLNRYFIDHECESAGRVAINRTDLDWFINYMLGITDRMGHLAPGHKTLFKGPDWSIDDASNSLEKAYTTANHKQYM